MKLFRLLSVALLATSLFLGSTTHNEVKAQPGLHISFQTFYNDLAPYGRWMNNAQYGSVWLPNVGPDFHPYMSNGNWVMTNYGNTWVSDFAWGWAPFHYGRWFLDDYYGWAWVPGYEWAPAWVSWRNGGGYYGWAPLGPGMNIGINISINIPSPWWIFVPQRYYMTNRWHNYRVPHNRVTTIYNQTTIINNYYNQDNRVYSYGPRREEIVQVTRRNVDVYRPEYVGRERYVSNRNGNYVDNSSRSRSSFIADNGRSNGESNRNNGTRIDNDSPRRSTYETSPRSTPSERNSSNRDNVNEAITNGRSTGTNNGRSTGRTYSNDESSDYRNRTYEAPTPRRGNYDDRASGRTYEAPTPRSSGRSGYEGNSNSRSYEAPTPRSSGRSGFEGNSSGRTYEAPSPRSSSRRSTGGGPVYQGRSESYSPRASSPSSGRASSPSASPRESGRSTGGERSSRGN